MILDSPLEGKKGQWGGTSRTGPDFSGGRKSQETEGGKGKGKVGNKNTNWESFGGKSQAAEEVKGKANWYAYTDEEIEEEGRIWEEPTVKGGKQEEEKGWADWDWNGDFYSQQQKNPPPDSATARVRALLALSQDPEGGMKEGGAMKGKSPNFRGGPYDRPHPSQPSSSSSLQDKGREKGKGKVKGVSKGKFGRSPHYALPGKW